MKPDWKILQGDVRERLRDIPAASVHCCITSPPYWALRDYGVDGQIGLEDAPDCGGWASGNRCGVCYVCTMTDVMRGVRHCLRDDGTLWLNLGDKYGAGKQLMGIPWRVAMSLQADGWILRSDVIWEKPNPMPQSVKDRPTTNHEYFFLLVKSEKYFYDAVAIREPSVTVWNSAKGFSSSGKRSADTYGQDGQFDGAKSHPDYTQSGRTKRSVWRVNVAAEKESHFATFPPKLIRPCILAGTSKKGCCPDCGAPYVRQVERIVKKVHKKAEGVRAERDRKMGGVTGAGGQKGTNTGKNSLRDGYREIEVKTVGWEPSCECNNRLQAVACTILDPFCGSGTTVAEAVKKNRRGIGIELNPEYIEIAERKIKRAVRKRGFGL